MEWTSAQRSGIGSSRGMPQNDVFSIERVGDELLAVAEELADWADDRGADFFLKPDANLLPALSTVSA